MNKIPLINAFSALNPINFENETISNFKNLKPLIEYFSYFLPPIEMTSLEQEFFQFHNMLQNHSQNLNEAVQFSLQNLFEVYPIFTKLLLISITCGVSNATCERAFSLMALTKTDLRNRLSDEHLCDVMMIAKNSPVKLSLNIIDLITDLFKQKNPRILL